MRNLYFFFKENSSDQKTAITFFFKGNSRKTMYKCAVTKCEILLIRMVKEQLYNPSKILARIILLPFDVFNKLEY